MKSLMRVGIPIVLLFSLVSAHASVSDFEKRFNVVRSKNGTLVEIKDKNFVKEVSIIAFMNFVKNLVVKGLANSRGEEVDPAEAANIIMERLYEDADLLERNDDLEWMRPVIEDSVSTLKKFDLNLLFKNRKVKKVLKDFEKELVKQWELLGLNTLSRPQDSQYFYKRNVGYQAVTFGLNIAKKFLSNVPVLNFASQSIVEYEKVVRERRIFHQNMLLHYIENYDAKSLGMTKTEVDQVVSSIYESRIAWFNIFESQNAQASWNKYGFNIFYRDLRVANQILVLRPDMFDSLGTRHNFAFIDAKVKGKKVILNLFNKAHQFSSKPAIAYYYNSPKKVEQERALIELTKVGLSLISMPDFIKDIARSHLNSMYKAHKLTEGALVAYLEEKQNPLKDQILNQVFNPFVR